MKKKSPDKHNLLAIEMLSDTEIDHARRLLDPSCFLGLSVLCYLWDDESGTKIVNVAGKLGFITEVVYPPSTPLTPSTRLHVRVETIGRYTGDQSSEVFTVREKVPNEATIPEIERAAMAHTAVMTPQSSELVRGWIEVARDMLDRKD